MSEIKIILDAFSQSSSLDESIKKLEKIIELSDKIKNNKDALKGGATSGNDTARLIAENAKLVESIDKIRAAEQKKQDTIKAEQGIIGSLKKEVKEYKKALDQATNLKDIENYNRKLTETEGKLKAVKNAGKEATNTFGNALSSFQFKFNALGQAIGQLAVTGLTNLASHAVDFGKEAVHAFIDAELNAKKLEVALKNISGEGKGSFERLVKQSEELQAISIFSDDDIQKSQTALVQYGLTSKEVEKLLPKILDLASAQGIDLGSATEIAIKAINGQTKGLRTAGIAFEDTGSKVGNLAKLTDNLNKFQGQSAAVMETNAGKIELLKNAYDDILEGIGEDIVFITNATIEGGTTLTEFIQASFGGLQGYADLALYKWKQMLKEIDKDIAAKEERVKGAFQDEFNEQSTSFLRKRYTRDQALLNQALESRKAAIAEGNKIQEKESNETIRALKREQETILEVLQKRNEKEASDKTKSDDKINERSIKESKRTEEIKYRDKLEIIKKGEEEEKTIIEKNNDEEIESNNREIAKKQRQKDEANDKELAAQEEFKRASLKFGEDLLKELEKLSEQKEALLDKEIDQQDKNIERQRELADKGLANTLAFEERKKAELERSKIAEQKKQEKIAKTQAFFNAFSSYSKDEPQTAAVKALKDVLLAEVVAKAFAKEGGIVGEIAEPIAGGRIDRGIFKGRSHLQGGIHLEAEGNEGIFSGREMGNLGRENFYALKNLLKNPIDDSIFERQNDSFNASIPIINVINKSDQVVEKLDELKKVIADKKETTWNIDAKGLISKEEFEKGFKTITQYKKAKRRF